MMISIYFETKRWGERVQSWARSTHYPHGGFRGILHPSQANCGVAPQIMSHPIAVASFAVIILPFDPVILVTNSVAK
jgi:hypothetical protein